jgi:hypothetical protein
MSPGLFFQLKRHFRESVQTLAAFWAETGHAESRYARACGWQVWDIFLYYPGLLEIQYRAKQEALARKQV